MLIRTCPNIDCNNVITYKLQSDYNKGIKNNTQCRSCSKLKLKTPESLTRKCPDCSTELSYKDKYSYYRAEKINSYCVKCSQTGERGPSYRTHHSNEHKLKTSKSMRRALGTVHIDRSQDPTTWDLTRWSKKARENTPFCEYCLWLGTDNDELEAHHILPKARYPHLALEQNNALVLCKEHHMLCHKQGGF